MASSKHICGQLKAAKGKTTTTQNQTFGSTSANTYGFLAPPDTKDIEALRGFQFEHDPRIPYAFARGRANLFNTYRNPLGGFTTPQLRDATLRAGVEDSAQQEAQALSEENQAFQGARAGKALSLASLTAPRLVQTGGTSSGTSSGTQAVKQPFDFGSIIQGGSNIGSALIM